MGTAGSFLLTCTPSHFLVNFSGLNDYCSEHICSVPDHERPSNLEPGELKPSDRLTCVSLTVLKQPHLVSHNVKWSGRCFTRPVREIPLFTHQLVVLHSTDATPKLMCYIIRGSLTDTFIKPHWCIRIPALNNTTQF